MNQYIIYEEHVSKLLLRSSYKFTSSCVLSEAQFRRGSWITRQYGRWIYVNYLQKDHLIRETNSCKNTVLCPLDEWFMYFNVLQRPPCHERPIYAFMWWVLLNGQWINSFHNLFFRYGTTKRWNYTGEIISPWFQSIQAIPKILSLKFTIIIPVGCNFAQNNYERITTK